MCYGKTRRPRCVTSCRINTVGRRDEDKELYERFRRSGSSLSGYHMTEKASSIFPFQITFPLTEFGYETL